MSSPFTFTDRRAQYVAKVLDLVRCDGAGFRSEAQRKEALGDLNYAYEEAKRAHQDAVSKAAPPRGDGSDEAAWAAYIGFVYDKANEVPDYLTGVKDSHLATFAKFGRDVADAVSGLVEIRNAVKVAPVNKPETKADKARKAAALVTPDRNIIAAAVAPMKADAIVRAAQDAQAIIDRVAAQLAAAGNDLDKAAPAPHWNEGRAKAESMKGKRSLFYALTTTRARRLLSEPTLADIDPKGCAVFIAHAEAMAAEHYDSFVAKLAAKIGECTAAEITGNHVWGFSILTVTKADTGAVERWKTQQIVNYSVYGKAFNQWPSRKVK